MEIVLNGNVSTTTFPLSEQLDQVETPACPLFAVPNRKPIFAQFTVE
jgi:hypothetical protein